MHVVDCKELKAKGIGQGNSQEKVKKDAAPLLSMTLGQLHLKKKSCPGWDSNLRHCSLGKRSTDRANSAGRG